MKTITIKVELSIGLSGCTQKDELTIEVKDDTTDSEIEEACEEAYQEWTHNYIDGSYSIITINSQPKLF